MSTLCLYMCVCASIYFAVCVFVTVKNGGSIQAISEVAAAFVWLIIANNNSAET